MFCHYQKESENSRNKTVPQKLSQPEPHDFVAAVAGQVGLKFVPGGLYWKGPLDGNHF
jgi:hypothetical protein